MKIKNNQDHPMYIGYKGLRPGFTLQGKQTSRQLPATIGLNRRLQADAQRGLVTVLCDDSDKRFLGDASRELSLITAPSSEPPAPVVEEPEEIVEEVVEEPEVVVEETVEVTDEVSADTEETPIEEVEEGAAEEAEEVADAEEEEEAGFSLAKSPSKMSKTDWLAAGMTDELGLKNEINPGMTKKVLQGIVEARIKELGL